MFSSIRRPLPVTSAESMRIAQRILADPLLSVRALSASVQSDPLLCAAVLREANSAAYGQRAGVATVARALEVIGLERTRSVAMRVVVQQIVNAIEPPGARSLAHALWAHSVTTACIVEQINVRDQRSIESAIDYQRAMLHELPALIFLGYSREHPALFSSIAAVRQMDWRHQVPPLSEIADWLGVPHSLVVRPIEPNESIDSVAIAHCLCPVASLMESLDTAPPVDIDPGSWHEQVERGVTRAREILFQH